MLGSVIYVFVLCVGERNVNLCGDFSELARKSSVPLLILPGEVLMKNW